MTTVFDTQKVRLDLVRELNQLEAQTAQESDTRSMLQIAEKIQWLKNKLSFLASPAYQERKKWLAEEQYPPRQFEQAPGEHQL